MSEPNNPRLGALWLTHPNEAYKECADALAFTNGNINDAARILGVGKSTMYRWVRRHGLGKEK